MKRYGIKHGFQMGIRNRQISAIGVAIGVLLCVQTSVAQEIEWPTPGRAPDILLGAEYGLNTFDQIYAPMHQGMIYGGLRSADGAYLLKLIRGRRFGQNGMQAEIEAYPLLGDRMYAYASYAYGETPVYPRHRAAAEVYRGLPGGFEASLGARYYGFPGDESVVLSTGSLSYYWGNFLFSIKPFVSLNLPKTAASMVLSSRYYLSDNEEFITARIGGGFNPDERWIQTAQGIPGRETTLLHSQTLGGAIQKVVMRKVMFLGRLDITRQEVVFSPGTYVLDVAIGCGLRVLL